MSLASDRSLQLSAPLPASTQLTGWGANKRTPCYLACPETVAEVASRLDPHGTIARGLGRSYGDAALNTHGMVLGMPRVDRYLAFDDATGVLVCEAGVSLERIIRDFAPRGWFPMITPGTKFVTVGGCIANDVHGKAHHAQGSFSACVESMTVLLASGQVLNASREEHSDLFWASFGGMGLLGVILTAAIRLRKIETTYFRQQPIHARNLDEMLAALDENDAKYPYSVAYVDPVATGDKLGSGILTVGDHATRAELPPELAKDPLHVSGPAKLRLPFELPEIALNPLTIRIVNVAIKQLQSSTKPFKHYEGFFYPLDIAHDWNRAYGKRGFTQYQFVIPFDDGPRRLRELLGAIVSSGELPFLNVLKRMGKQSEGHLSFPTEGYTFAIDFPIRAGTEALTRRLDAMVLDAGGRIYLGKDAFVNAETFRAMYPRLDEWLAVKRKYDPDTLFTSDLGRRVGLVPEAATRASEPEPADVEALIR
ncbi:MAG: FAD-binding oxidoreductase [Polyangiales bacterium]